MENLRFSKYPGNHLAWCQKFKRISEQLCFPLAVGFCQHKSFILLGIILVSGVICKMPLKIVVIYGSVRTQRQGIKAARFIVNKLKERTHEVTLIDPLEFKLPLLDKRYMDYKPGTAPENIEKVAQILKNSDCFVIISGEYNHSIPPALKNILDHYYNEYLFKPAAIATYSAGPFGGVRAGVQLRAILGELRMVTIPTMFPISMVQDAFDENGNAIEKEYDKRVVKFLDEFEWYANALKEAREKVLPY